MSQLYHILEALVVTLILFQLDYLFSVNILVFHPNLSLQVIFFTFTPFSVFTPYNVLSGM